MQAKPAAPGTRAIFLSYAHEDAAAAERIAAALRTDGIEVWFDQSELRGGDAWDQKIRREIKDCGLFVPLISRHTQSRLEGYFRLEWRLAEQRSHLMAKGKPFILPITLDETSETNAHVPDAFVDVQWIRMGEAEELATLVARVRVLIDPATIPPFPIHLGAGPVPMPARRPGRTWIAVAAALALAVPLGLFVRGRFLAPDAPPDRSIAVLPFENMSDDKEANAFFAEGMHEDILTQLLGIRDLRVVSRTTVLNYRATKKSAREIGHELHVAYILMGSVRRAASQLRVTGELIDARTDQQLWSRSFDRELRDVFKIQSELAHAIADGLKAALSPQEERQLNLRPTDNLASYDLYLKGRQLRHIVLQGAVAADAEQLLRKAVTLDPQFAAAWGELAYIYAFAYMGDRSPATRGKAQDAIDTAMRLAADSPLVMQARGDFLFYAQNDYGAAITEYEKLAALQPGNADVLFSLADASRAQGRWPVALGYYARCAELDPAHRRNTRDYALLLGAARRFPEAVAQQRHVVELVPDELPEQFELAYLAFAASGSTREVEEFFHGLSAATADSPPVIALRKTWAYRHGDLAEFIRLDQLQPYYGSTRLLDRGAQATTAAVVLAARGDRAAVADRLGTMPADYRALVAREPNNDRAWGHLALMEALLGHHDEARRCADRAMELVPVAAHPFFGPRTLAARAFVRAWRGDKSAALDDYERLLTMPFGSLRNIGPFTGSSVFEMKADPTYAPLHGEPRFESLLNDPKNQAPLF